MKVKKIFIGGMHCKGCVTLLTEEYQKVYGVKNVDISLKNGIAKIYYDRIEPSFKEIQKISKKLGYEAYLTKPLKNGILSAGPKQWVISIIIATGLIILYTFLRRAGLLDFINLSNSSVSFGVSFLIGIVASLSTCFVIVGSVIIAFNEKYNNEENKDSFSNAIVPNVLFQSGRVVTFFILGGILGLIGGELNLSGRFVSIYTLIVAAVMLILSINILGISPSLNLGFNMPKSVGRTFSRLKDSRHFIAPLLLGGLTFFLPCGFTQSMQIFALTSGSFTKGALSLFFFAIGTLPVLLITGITAAWTKNRKMVVFQKVAGILILVFAISTFKAGFSLIKVNTPILSSSNSNIVEQGDNIPAQQNEQIVEMHITYNGFEPQVLNVKKGVPVKWVIYGDQITGCTNHVVVPELNISSPVKEGENVIRFTPKKEGTINFSCWMGMVRGKFVVK
jgi:sulfite exporter TauE/SafE/copper chaperone CopZ